MMMLVNPTYILTHFFEYCWSAYDVIGPMKYPLLVLGIVGYVFLYTKSATLAVVTIIVAFSIFGGTGLFAGSQVMNSFLGTITIVGIASLLLAVIIKKEVSQEAG
jgi:hypothetical protein